MRSRKSGARDRTRKWQLAAGALEEVARGQPQLDDRDITTNSPGPEVPLEQLLPPLLPYLSPTTCSSLLQSSKGCALLVLLHAPHAKLTLHGEVTHRRLRALRALLPGLQHLGLQGCRFTGFPAGLKRQAFLLCFTIACLTSMLLTMAHIWAVTLAVVVLAVLSTMVFITGCLALGLKSTASPGLQAAYDASYCIARYLLWVAATGFAMGRNTDFLFSLLSKSSSSLIQHVSIMCLLPLPPSIASIVISSREVSEMVVRKWLGGRCFYLRPPRPSSSWPVRSLTCTGCTPLGGSLHAALTVVDATQLQVLTTDDARVCAHLDQLPALQRLAITRPAPPTSAWADGMGAVTDAAFQRLLRPHPVLRAVSLEGLGLQQDHTHTHCHWEELTLNNPTLGQLGRLPLNSIPRCVVRGSLTMGRNTTAADDDTAVLVALSRLEANPHVIFEPTTGLQAFGLAPDDRGFVLRACHMMAFDAHIPRCIALCTRGGWNGVLVFQDCLLVTAAVACSQAPLPATVSAVCFQGSDDMPDGAARLFSFLPAHVVRLVVKGSAAADPAVTYLRG